MAPAEIRKAFEPTVGGDPLNPASMAMAARKASGTKFPWAFVIRQSFVKISQCRGPGATTRQLGWARNDSANSRALSRGLGGVNNLGCVVIRRKPLRTMSARPKGWPELTVFVSQRR